MEKTESKASKNIFAKIAGISAKRYLAVVGLWAVLVLTGIFAYTTGLSREGFPSINFPIGTASGTYFADSPETVDKDVTGPLSEALIKEEGIESINATALDNSFFMIVEFSSDLTSQQGVEILEKAAKKVTPKEALIEFKPLQPAKFLERYDLLISVKSDNATPAELQERADEVVEHMVKSPEIETAETQDLFTTAVDPATGQEVERQTSFNRFASADGEFKNSISIGLIRADTGLDIIEFSDAVKSQIESDPSTDENYETVIGADQATDVRFQLSSLQSNLFTGLLAVAAVSLLLIGWRVAIVTSAFMISTVITALVLLWVFGLTLNVITLFALILTLGLLVDDAVVIAESIEANRKQSKSPIEVVRYAIGRVGAASFSGTLTTVLVFIPLLFVTGILGEFIRVMPITIVVTLLVSFVLSIILIPALASPFILKGKANENFIIRAEEKAANWLSKIAKLFSENTKTSIIYTTVGVVGSLGIVFFIASTLFSQLSFNIFPAPKDSNAFVVTADFDNGTTIEEAEELSKEIDEAVSEQLGDNLLRAQYVISGSRNAILFINLVSFNDREIASPELIEMVQSEVDNIKGAKVSAEILSNGPPTEDFPFKVQINVSDDSEAAVTLANDISEKLNGNNVERANGEEALVTETEVFGTNEIIRVDNKRQISVGAKFDADDITALTEAAEKFVTENFGEEELTSRGLNTNTLEFDQGQESDNQEDFAATGTAGFVALLAMAVLLTFQFRSLFQPILIMMAIPFGLIGVFWGLLATNNPISFIAVIGVIGLIGVVVNNTILLTDSANQGRREGLGASEAIAEAIRIRFRPLIATTLTTIAGLTPLALADPFWEPLAVAMIFGLLVSTILVLFLFPIYYRFFSLLSGLLWLKVKNSEWIERTSEDYV